MQVTTLDYLENSTSRFPDKIALKDLKEEFTYAQFMNTARIIGTNIAKRTTPRHSVVIYMAKKASCVIAFHGTVYAGCYYTPVDSQMPVDRIKMILDSLNPAVVIYDATTEDNIKALGVEDKAVSYEEISQGEIDADVLAKIRRQQVSTDLIYVLYTSGSTGVPKGVTISHLAIMDVIEWANEEYHIDDSVRVCNQAPFYFDLSAFDMYTAFKAGGTLYIPPKTYYTFPVRIVQYMKEHKINFINWAPSAMCNVVNTGAFDVCVPDDLKIGIFAGEVMPCRHLNVWRKYIPDCLYINAYGPTEIAYVCMFYNVDREFADDGVIPLGGPCKNTKILLLDDELKPVKDGEKGEICVLGQCLSYGYFNNPEKTAEAFVQNPLNDEWHERMYKTGDLAYMDTATGELVFCGRKDNQIKRLGYRIELGEIENAILSINGIKNACCIYDQESSDIFAIYAGDLTENDILEELNNKLQTYMLPNQFVQLDEMPLNPNGKIDRPYLKKTYIG